MEKNKEKNMEALIRQNIQDIKRTRMNPLDKYNQFSILFRLACHLASSSDIFPFRTLIQVILALLVSSQIFFLMETNLAYSRAQIEMLKVNLIVTSNGLWMNSTRAILSFCLGSGKNFLKTKAK